LWVAGGLLALALSGGPGIAEGQEELVVTNFTNNSVTVYARTANGNTAPLRTLQGVATGLSGPVGVALDLVHNELVVTNFTNNSVTVYARTASGNTAPLRTLQGAATGLSGLGAVAVDLIHDEMAVANGGNGSVTVHARTASGNTPPLRTLQGAATGLSGPAGVVLDLLHDELVVTNGISKSVTVYARTANGNTAPLRTLQGAATGLKFPVGVALDLVHEELVVANLNGTVSSVEVYLRTASGNTAPLRTLQDSFTIGIALDLVHDELIVASANNAVTVYTRTASGSTAPVRTVAGAGTGLSQPQFAALSTSPPLAAAVLPLSRSHQVGTLLTAFATIINAGPGPVQQCLVQTPASPPAGLGPFVFQTTDLVTNAATGTPNTPASIPAGGMQTFVFGFTPTAPIPETALAMTFLCENTATAASISGVTSFTLVADIDPVPDAIALIATVSGDGVVRIPGSTGVQLFAIGTANVGATGSLTVSADTGGVALPIMLTVCETDATGACLALPGPDLTLQYAAGTTHSFAFFAQATGSISFDPASNRVFARLKDAGGVTRGTTSAALCTGC
jgi:hypothetical protein